MNAYLALDDDSIQRIKQNNPQLEKILGNGVDEFLMNRLLQMMIWKLNFEVWRKTLGVSTFLWHFSSVTIFGGKPWRKSSNNWLKNDRQPILREWTISRGLCVASWTCFTFLNIHWGWFLPGCQSGNIVESWISEIKTWPDRVISHKSINDTTSLGCSDILWGNCSFEPGSLPSLGFKGSLYETIEVEFILAMMSCSFRKANSSPLKSFFFQMLNSILLNKTLNLLVFFGLFIFQLLIQFQHHKLSQTISFVSRDNRHPLLIAGTFSFGGIWRAAYGPINQPRGPSTY